MEATVPDGWRVSLTFRTHTHRKAHLWKDTEPACGALKGMQPGVTRSELFSRDTRSAASDDHLCRDCVRLGAPGTLCACPRCALERRGREEGQRARLMGALKAAPARYRYGVYRAQDGALIERYVFAGEARSAARRFGRAMRERFRARRLPKVEGHGP